MFILLFFLFAVVLRKISGIVMQDTSIMTLIEYHHTVVLYSAILYDLENVSNILFAEILSSKRYVNAKEH